MMKVVDLINKLEELGYNKNTKICLGFCDYGGEWYDFKVEEIEDDDRAVDVDTIGVVLEPNKEYSRAVLEEANIELEEDLRAIISKYC